MHDDVRNDKSFAVLVKVGAPFRQPQTFRSCAIPVILNVHAEIRELILKIQGQASCNAALAEVEFKEMPIILHNPAQRIVEPPSDLIPFHVSASGSSLRNLSDAWLPFNLP